MKEEGLYEGHTSCVLSDCNSSDGLAIYVKTDDEGKEFRDGYCYSCERYVSPKHLGDDYEFVKYESRGRGLSETDISEIFEYEHRGVKERKLAKTYCEMYGMRVSYDTETGGISEHYYPVTKDNKITGYKVRKLPKEFIAIGDTKKCQLFGQWLFDGDGAYVDKASKKFLIICEGELDTIAMQQAMMEHGNNYVNAVVGLPNGANARAVKDNYKFINSFENVILVLDQDESGRNAAIEIAKALPMGKAKIASYSEKDPCEMVKRKKSSELSKLIWKSEPYSPSGILDGSGLWEVVSKPMENESEDYPWAGLNALTCGIRTSELVTIVAGSGVAKSTFARKIFHYLLENTDAKIGGMFLEESIRKTGLSLMSFSAKKLLHLPKTEATQDELKEAFDNTLGTGRVFLFDSFGSNDLDTICENIVYFAKAAGCKYIFLDHISILVSGGLQGDERRALDQISTKLRTLVQELDISLIMISHLKRPEGKAHEEGAATSLAQIRGSAGIAQLSDIVIGIERNGQAEDETVRNTSTLRVLKNRFSGETGVAARVFYDSLTGELTEVFEDEESDEDSEFEDIPLNSFLDDDDLLRAA